MTQSPVTCKALLVEHAGKNSEIIVKNCNISGRLWVLLYRSFFEYCLSMSKGVNVVLLRLEDLLVMNPGVKKNSSGDGKEHSVKCTDDVSL